MAEQTESSSARPAQGAGGGRKHAGAGAANANASRRPRPRASPAATSRRSTPATSTARSRCGPTGGRENVRGQVDVLAPEGVRAFIGELLGALPDLQIRGRLDHHRRETAARVHWRLRGTFAGPGRFGGIAPPASRLDLEGCDLLTVSDGLIQANDAFTDSMSFAREIGMMPPQDSAAEQRMTGAFNAKTRVTGRLAGGEAELVAQGVWVRAGTARPLQRVPDRGRRRRDRCSTPGARTMTRAVASAGGQARRHPPDRARPRPHRSPRHRARRSARRCCATPTKSRTPKAAAAFATGPRAWPGCRSPSASSTACSTATPGTAGP